MKRISSFATMVAVLVLVPASLAVAADPVRVNVTSAGAETHPTMWSSTPALSADGRFIAFDSDAPDLVPGDTNGERDVFVRDRLTGTTTRVSVSSTGAPIGNTAFDFRAAGLSFRSTSYAWLVIAGARAQLKGTGAINGAGNYAFLLTAIDGDVVGGGGLDKVRLKIWDPLTGAIVYDNQTGAPDDGAAATQITGGSIVVHR
jgi:hypothetical protein